MVRHCCRRLPPLLVLLLIGGCLYPVRDKVDRVVCDLAAIPRDVQAQRIEGTPATESKRPDELDKPAKNKLGMAGSVLTEKDKTITLASAEQPAPRDVPSILTRLKLPNELPGTEAKPIVLPAYDPKNRAERDKVIDNLYPPLEPLGPDPQPLPGPDGHPLTLSDLQRLALEKHPAIRQAAARVEAARGAAIQAGLPPNPTFGPEADTIGTSGAPGYQGFFFDQVIRLPNKLQLQRAIAAMDLRNAEVALRRAETDLAHQVRGNYFAVLVGLENIKVSKALVAFTTSVYDIQLDQLKGGQVAAYEPSLLRVSAVQARLQLYLARNQYESAWKQLAASLGRTGMAPTEVVGRLDIAVPLYDHARVLEYAQDRHTDILTARNTLLQTNYQLRLAQLQPVSDVDLRVGIQKDYTDPTQAIVNTVGLTFTIPLWDRNQGGIIQAQGNTVAASEQEHVTRVNLAQTLNTAFLAYENNRIAVDLYRKEILPRQVQGYRALYERFQFESPKAGGNVPAFGDIITAQGTLSSNVQAYIVALGALWQSVADVADVLQTDDLYMMGNETLPTDCPTPVPDLSKLPPLPCCHPCAPPDGAFPSDNGAWPSAAPHESPRVKPVLPDDGATTTPKPAPLPEESPKGKSTEGPKSLPRMADWAKYEQKPATPTDAMIPPPVSHAESKQWPAAFVEPAPAIDGDLKKPDSSPAPQAMPLLPPPPAVPTPKVDQAGMPLYLPDPVAHGSDLKKADKPADVAKPPQAPPNTQPAATKVDENVKQMGYQEPVAWAKGEGTKKAKPVVPNAQKPVPVVKRPDVLPANVAKDEQREVLEILPRAETPPLVPIKKLEPVSATPAPGIDPALLEPPPPVTGGK